MTSSSALLLGACTGCGEPIFRHRLPNGRQISCQDVRLIDQRFQASTPTPQQAKGDLERAARVLDFHGGER